MSGYARTVMLPDTLTPESLPALNATLAQTSAEGVGAPLVLRGEGKVFCKGLGLDFVSGSEEFSQRVFAQFIDVFKTLNNHQGATIALVAGTTAGGGTGLAAACDHVIATQTASFALPEVLLGLTPASIAPYLIARMGPAMARRMMLDGAARDAGWALEAGLVDQICATDNAEKALRQTLRLLGRGEGDAIRAARRLTAPPDLLQRLRSGQTETLKRLKHSTVQDRIARFNAGQAPWLKDT